MKGLAFRKTAEALAEFVKARGQAAPRRAVLCTYDFHPERFEASLLPELTRRGRWFRTLVLADNAALQKDGVLTSRAAEPTYELAPVRLRGTGVFHPKLLVVQAGPHVLVGVGSANLTPGGLGANLELMLFAGTDQADGKALAGSASEFLHALRSANFVQMPASARRFVERAVAALPRQGGGPILHNLERPLVDELAAGRPATVSRTAVVSPWHSSMATARGVEPGVLRAVGRALGAQPTVYTEGMKGQGPNLGSSTDVHVLMASPAETENEREDRDEVESSQRTRGPARPVSLHAKAYLAAGPRAATLWFGSANCTTPALLRPARANGNVELLVRVELGASARARIEHDLAGMFEPAKGRFAAQEKPRIPAPRGAILSGYVPSWDKPALRLELVAGTTGRILVSRTRRLQDAVEVAVTAATDTVTVPAAGAAKLLAGGEPPAFLWEHTGASAVAFPVSVAASPLVDDPQEMLDDWLDELYGRVPAAFAGRRARAAISDDDDPDSDDDLDPELALLTQSEHEGRLDRIAVRVELLRKRLSAIGAQSWAHYRDALDKQPLAPALRRVLLAHLGTAKERA